MLTMVSLVCLFVCLLHYLSADLFLVNHHQILFLYPHLHPADRQRRDAQHEAVFDDLQVRKGRPALHVDVELLLQVLTEVDFVHKADDELRDLPARAGFIGSSILAQN